MWDDPRQMNALAAIVALIGAGALVWALGAWLVRQPVFAFREVVVEGPLTRASAPHLEAVIRDELAGTFFTMNLERARASLARVPWVRAVALRRQWPQRLLVTVEEQVPLARWNDTALVNVQGEVFAASYNGELPAFAGPDGRSGEVTSRFREWSAALQPIALAVQRIALSPRGGWMLQARSGDGPLEIELGREEPAARLQRFIATHGRTLRVLARAGRPIDHVDLRHRNGFAARVPGFKERPPKRAGT
jgi:cell division protein FtsQ